MSTQTRQVKHKPSTLARTHCKNGHQWIPENLTVRANGGKECKVCHSIYAKKRAKRVQAEHAALYYQC